MSLVLLAVTLWITVGQPYPPFADGQTWLWLSLSGFVGYVLGDYCLFQSYICMNSRFGQLFMTLASPAAAIAAWVLLNEQMSLLAVLGMTITMIGIGMSILTRASDDESSDSHRRRVSLSLPLKGVLFGIGAGTGQGVGLVLSKVGMEYYTESISQCGISDMSAFSVGCALVPVSLAMIMPFASTMIRAVTGMVGFTAALMLFSRSGGDRLVSGMRDGKAMRYAFLASFFGPFVGVALSLMATLYTSTGIAQTIMATTPVLIILPSWLFFHQRVTLIQVIGACISVVGVSLFFV